MRRRSLLTTQDLALVALEFRRAIERSNLRRHARVMSRFPVGCCKQSSQLLARFLVTELQVPLVTFVHAERGGTAGDAWQSHVWLSVDQHYIDITADQYPEIEAPVVVSMSGGWHTSWERKRHLTYGEMMNFDRWEALRFERMYRAVFRALQPTPRPRVHVPLRNAGPPAELA